MLKRGYRTPNELVCSLLFEELKRWSVATVVHSPGSRNSPLVLAAADTGGIDIVSHYDERGAAFFAIGLIRATNRPVALVCTSGSAAANYYPAVVEAHADQLPLVILTADRPPELHGCGANQTMSQEKLYGQFVRDALSLPSGDELRDTQSLLESIDKLMAQSSTGPVHCNLQFREPLVAPSGAKYIHDLLSPISDWLASDEMFLQESIETSDERVDVDKVAQLFASASRPLALIGQLRSEIERESAVNLVNKLGWPVLTDISANLRGSDTIPNQIRYFGPLLSIDSIRDRLRPDLILHIGGRIVSKRLLEFLKESAPAEYVQITNSIEPFDPNRQVTHRIKGDVAETCEKLGGSDLTIASIDLLNLESESKIAEEMVGELICNHEEINEPQIAIDAYEQLTDGGALWVASSMPIRECDLFCFGAKQPTMIGCNRGVSGIDGTIASAIGMAYGLNRPTTLLIGDLAFLHDCNSLSLARSLEHPLTIVLVNNDGGGIFSFLPVADHADQFERLFGASHGYSFGDVARQFGLAYAQPVNRSEFVEQYRHARTAACSTIIEVKADRTENRKLHDRILDELADRLRV
jgi:2-succinyl-5-enolpyruvyl-6-hydroxy-3-cyclohexene-1-carboxylate synthase